MSIWPDYVSEGIAPCRSLLQPPIRHLSPCFSPSTSLDMSSLHQRRISRVVLALCTVIALSSRARAHSNGMDMSMDGAMDLSGGQMIPWLHFTPGDILWFYGWVPSSTGAMVGTCIGLFLLALVDRWIAACRAVMEVHWSKRYVFPSLNSSFPLRTKSSMIVPRMLLLELCRDYHPSSVRLD